MEILRQGRIPVGTNLVNHTAKLTETTAQLSNDVKCHERWGAVIYDACEVCTGGFLSAEIIESFLEMLAIVHTSTLHNKEERNCLKA